MTYEKSPAFWPGKPWQPLKLKTFVKGKIDFWHVFRNNWYIAENPPMKRILLAAVVLISLHSCKSHVYFISSNTNVNSDSAFYYENDTIRITYNLWVNRGRMEFSIFNKLNVPLFIDWKNSSFILNDTPDPYWVDKTETKSRVSGGTYKGFSAYTSSGVSVKEDRVTMIPPKSKINKSYSKYLCVHETYTKADVGKHFRNFIAYSANEDTKGEAFADCEFKVVLVKTIPEGKTKGWAAPKRFYTRR